jgi:ATP-dependent helicase YprA (DUF1998 family)
MGRNIPGGAADAAVAPASLAPLAEELGQDSRLGGEVVHAAYLPPQPARFGELAAPLPPALAGALQRGGVARLWSHQVEALDAVARGENVLVTTPTASGKSLVFQIPPLLEAAAGGEGRALFLFPLKALGQDQRGKMEKLVADAGFDPARAGCEIYDGDTPPARRAAIRRRLPRVLITNPDMLHLGLLGHWTSWGPLLADLRWIVIDELHTYRGIFGSHFHHVLQRLLRLCRSVGGQPVVIASSATAANAAQFATDLTGCQFHWIAQSGAPREGRHLLLVRPDASPYTAALRLFIRCLDAGLKTIMFTKARRITELLYSWLRRQEPRLAARVASYRAGFLAEERRGIEQSLFSGTLDGVISTSALEMGIDVGGLDACILVGYPGSMMATWQRSGRVGRADRESITALVAMPDALDQYFLDHPDQFLHRPCERLVVDPTNQPVARAHLLCAAAELPLAPGLDAAYLERHKASIDYLLRAGHLLQAAGAPSPPAPAVPPDTPAASARLEDPRAKLAIPAAPDANRALPPDPPAGADLARPELAHTPVAAKQTRPAPEHEAVESEPAKVEVEREDEYARAEVEGGDGHARAVVEREDRHPTVEREDGDGHATAELKGGDGHARAELEGEDGDGRAELEGGDGHARVVVEREDARPGHEVAAGSGEDAAGDDFAGELYCLRRQPQRMVALRGSGNTFAIFAERAGGHGDGGAGQGAGAAGESDAERARIDREALSAGSDGAAGGGGPPGPDGSEGSNRSDRFGRADRSERASRTASARQGQRRRGGRADHGRLIGTVDGVRALHECHPGAVYLHAGRQYLVKELEREERRVRAVAADLDYFTTPLTEKQTEILEVLQQSDDGALACCLGRLKVTEWVVGFERKRVHGQETIDQTPLDLPPVEFETVGLWWQAPRHFEETLRRAGEHFLGALHAAEHASISLFPLLALCDRGDIGGISYPLHPQVGCGAVFIYDGHPGGIGIAARGFEDLSGLLDRVLQLIDGCPCEAGCPSCIQSPKCGNGNRPLHKSGAARILRLLLGREAAAVPPIPPLPATAFAPPTSIPAAPPAALAPPTSLPAIPPAALAPSTSISAAPSADAMPLVISISAAPFADAVYLATSTSAAPSAGAFAPRTSVPAALSAAVFMPASSHPALPPSTALAAPASTLASRPVTAVTLPTGIFGTPAADSGGPRAAIPAAPSGLVFGSATSISATPSGAFSAPTYIPPALTATDFASQASISAGPPVAVDGEGATPAALPVASSALAIFHPATPASTTDPGAEGFGACWSPDASAAGDGTIAPLTSPARVGLQAGPASGDPGTVLAPDGRTMDDAWADGPLPPDGVAPFGRLAASDGAGAGAGPLGTGPLGTSPLGVGPSGADTLGTGPVDADPLGKGPLGTGPLGAGPLGTGPLGAGPLGTGPLGAGPLGTGPLGAGPLGADPLGTGPLGAGPLGTGPLGAGPLGTGPLGADPLGTGPAVAGPLGTGPLEVGAALAVWVGEEETWRRARMPRVGAGEEAAAPARGLSREQARRHKERPNTLLFDVETLRSAAEVGGFGNCHRMGVAVAVACFLEEGRFVSFGERRVHELAAALHRATLVIGYNIKRFDYGVLAGYTGEDYCRTLPTLDLLEEVHHRLGFRLGMGRLAMATLGSTKSADGLQSLEWVRQGRIDLVEEYCRHDVEILRDLYLHGRREGCVVYHDPRRDVRLRVAVDW